MNRIIILFAFIPYSLAYNSYIYTKYMLNKHHKLVPYYAYKYFKHKNIPNQHKQDIIQEGYIGLYYAARKYDPNRNVSFSYYSKFWIMRYLKVSLTSYYKQHNLFIPLNDKLTTASYDYEIHPIYNDIQKLLPYHQDIITRRYLNNEKVKDIAKYYNVSRNSMSNHIKHAISILRILYFKE